MSSFYYYNNYLKNSGKMAKNELALHTVSTELKHTSNIQKYNSKYYNQPKYMNIKLFKIKHSNNSLRKTKIFKDIKYCYSFIKPPSIKKKKAIKKSPNNIPCVSFTGINHNLKKTFNSNFNTSNLINIDNNANKNKLGDISFYKSSLKSKNNIEFLTPLQYYNIHSRNKTTNFNLIKSNSFIAKSFNNSNNISTKINTDFFCSIQKKISDTIQREVEDPHTKIEKLKEELDKKEKELNVKNKIIEENEKKINELQKMCEQYENGKKIMNKNYEELNEKYEKIHKENIEFKSKMEQIEINYNFLKEKEITLMKVLYMLKRKGIDLNDILNEINNELKDEVAKKNKEPIIDSDSSSSITIYFPDKINMISTMENKGAKKIPNLDFNQIPEYSFQSENEQNELNNQGDNLKNYTDINKYFKLYQKSA